MYSEGNCDIKNFHNNIIICAGGWNNKIVLISLKTKRLKYPNDVIPNIRRNV